MITIFAAVLLATAAPASAEPSPVQASRHQAADRTLTLVHEVVIDAPQAAVWDAIINARGWQGWAAPVARDVAPDIIETSYSADAKPGDATTIRQQILFRAPQRLMLFRTTKAPAGFPDFDVFAKVTHLFELEPLGDERTRVRLTGSGYADSVAGRRLLGFFDRGNALTLAKLRDRLSRPIAPSALVSGLAPLAFLVGHCWSATFADGKQVDRHCFEPAFGGQFVRDRHQVTGGKDIYRGETLYSWNAAIRRVDFNYWNSLGGVSRGTMTTSHSVLDFGDQNYVGSDGKSMTIRAQWRTAGDSYQVVSSVNGVDGGRAITYRRVD